MRKAFYGTGFYAIHTPGNWVIGQKVCFQFRITPGTSYAAKLNYEVDAGLNRAWSAENYEVDVEPNRTWSAGYQRLLRKSEV